MKQSPATESAWIAQIQFDATGLIPVIAQEVLTRKVLMFAYMNQESLLLTMRTGQAVYWSRSRQRLWHKGEESGHVQRVREIRLDCDGDVLLMKVEQQGGIACHTGRESCFFQKLEGADSPAVAVWTITDPVILDPATIYAEKKAK